MSIPFFKHLVEIGAGDSYSTQGARLLGCAEKVTLYEPNRLLYADLKRAATGIPNLEVLPLAVSNVGGPTPLYHFGYASYLDGASSFLATAEPKGIDPTFWSPLARLVPTVAMEEIDTGDIDCLILTVNGLELAILDSMKSRPAVMRTKHYVHNAAQWGYAGKVIGWLQRNGYVGRELETNRFRTFLHLEWRRAG